MKNLITILTITLSLFAFSATAQTQKVRLHHVDPNFSKAKLKKLFLNNGISQQEFNQIGGMHAVIDALKKVNGKWQFTTTKQQQAKLSQFSNGTIQFNSADMGSDEFSSADMGSDEFVDIVMGGTEI